MTAEDASARPPDGIALARGVCRMLIAQGFAPLTEFVPARGLRMDIIALGPRGEVWVVEVKSSVADFRADAKWQGYLEWSEQFFFAVPADFPAPILPAEGLIRADPFSAEIVAQGPLRPMAPARRKALTLAFARTSAVRLAGLIDPGAQMV